MNKHQLLVCGLQWTNPQPPSCKHMIRLLENNEAFISWISPNGGCLEDQFAVIRMEDGFYTLSLRLLKSIFRHVKLKKGFINRQYIPHVGIILRIPTVLLQDKKRTQLRFRVSSRRASLVMPPPPLKACVRPGDAIKSIRRQTRYRLRPPFQRHELGRPRDHHQAVAAFLSHGLPPQRARDPPGPRLPDPPRLPGPCRHGASQVDLGTSN